MSVLPNPISIKEAGARERNSPGLKTSTLVKNGFANLARGSTTALISLVLTPFLTRYMSAIEYGAWALILQIAAYTSYLDFGIQTAVGRFIAYSNEKQDEEHQNKIASTSFAMLIVAMLFSIAIFCWIGWNFESFFRGVPKEIVAGTRFSLLLVGFVLAI